MPFKYHLPRYFKLLINYKRLILKQGPTFAFNYISLFMDFKALVLFNESAVNWSFVAFPQTFLPARA